ncbi:hypothetical protein WJX82_006054 [Trebouxia sp. C0006]
MRLRRSSGRSFWRSLVLETLEERSFLDRLAKKGCLMDAVERTRMNQILTQEGKQDEAGKRQKCESETAQLQHLEQVENHHQQQYVRDAEKREALQAALTAAKQETADVKAMASQFQAQLMHAIQQRKHATSSKQRQWAEQKKQLDDQELR